MFNTKFLFSLLFIGVSSLSFAESISEEEMKKAMESITQIRVMETNEPKTVSEVIVTEKVTKQIPEKVMVEKLIPKKTTNKVSKKKIAKKKVHKKKVHKKKIYKKKKVEEEIDVSQLQDVQTLGVVDTSEPFELKH